MYLADSLQLTSEVAVRRRMRSVDSPTMLVPSTCPSILGDRTFPVAAARAWNSLPPQTRAASSLLTLLHTAEDQVSSFPSVIWLTEICAPQLFKVVSVES